MSKKFGLFALCLSLMLTSCSMPAIGLQRNDAGSRQEEEDDEEEMVEAISEDMDGAFFENGLTMMFEPEK